MAVAKVLAFRKVFRKPSGSFQDAGFERVTYDATYGTTYGDAFHYLHSYLWEPTYGDCSKSLTTPAQIILLTVAYLWYQSF